MKAMLGGEYFADVAEGQKGVIGVLVDLGWALGGESPGLPLSGASPLPQWTEFQHENVVKMWEGACP
ncbi:hypothetical protein BOP93_24770 [Pseudomonas orientalis]|uniref:Uncharacterized protein n=1 Tax=Pseudomonas orientalis TaxID=76758 RepID=A0A2L0S380_9PSED|nr:hypothetical protein BOP93_24770 [Pseudomonas orientalis]